MKRKLRPRRRVEIESSAKTMRKALLSSHVRRGGEPTPHACNRCLCVLHATEEHVPDWLVAPCCGEVWHDACLTRYVRESERDGVWNCPQCKTAHDEESIFEWDCSEVLERLFPEEDYKPHLETCEEDCEGSVRSTRVTRAKGPPEDMCRRTRSSGVYW